MTEEKRDESKVPTLDDPKRPPSVRKEENAPTRYVRPHVDHSVNNPRAKPPSASQLAAQAPTVADASDGVRGVLGRADFDGGDFVIRIAGASASMRALMQLASSVGAEIEIVIRRRAP